MAKPWAKIAMAHPVPRLTGHPGARRCQSRQRPRLTTDHSARPPGHAARVDRLLADSEVPGDVGDLAARLNEINHHPAPDRGRLATSSQAVPLQDRLA